MATKTKIIFTPPSGIQVKYSLDRAGTYILGTDESCDITLDDNQLAVKHGKLVADETNEARWFLQDLETGAIAILEDGSEHAVGRTKIDVSIEKLEDEIEEDDDEEDEYEDDDDEFEDDDDEYEDEPSPKFSTVDPADNEVQLEQLMKAHQLREIKSTVILIVVCAILAFAAGVAFRLMK